MQCAADSCLSRVIPPFCMDGKLRPCFLLSWVRRHYNVPFIESYVQWAVVSCIGLELKMLLTREFGAKATP